MYTTTDHGPSILHLAVFQQSPFHMHPARGVPVTMRDRPIATPLRQTAWQQALAQHPDQQWAQIILRGIRDGFRIGLQANPSCQSTAQNSPSALAQAQVVDEYIANQLEQGYLVGPYTPDKCPGSSPAAWQ